MVAVSAVLGTYPWTAPLKNHEVTPVGFELEFFDFPGALNEQFRVMTRDLAYGVSEMAWHTYLAAKEHGKPFTAIPFFPWRAWPHEVITVNKNAGINSPKDLEGKRVAMRGYTVTPGTWLRALLAHEYGVDTDKITYVLSVEEHVPEFELPPNVELMIGANLAPLVASGEIDAAIAIAPPDGNTIVPLFSNTKELHNVWRAKGIFPINHGIVIRDDVIAEHPEFPGELYRACLASKEPFLGRLANGKLTTDDLGAIDRADIVGPQSISSGIEENRITLEAAVTFAIEQHMLNKSIPIEDLFATT